MSQSGDSQQRIFKDGPRVNTLYVQAVKACQTLLMSQSLSVQQKVQVGMFTNQRLRTTCASAQSDQSLQ